jgi:hypothetical protein
MSLRIRRGTNNQRTSLPNPFDNGEIVWTTDTKKLYVGDGSTVGGNNILSTSVDGLHGISWHEPTQTLRFNGVGTGIPSVSADATPSLGGNLNAGTYNITGTGAITATTITATNLGGNLNTGSYNITGTGSFTAGTISAGFLGANLNLNSKSLTGTATINISGAITATSIAATNLGGNLNLNARTIDGLGTIGITGNISATASVGSAITGTTTSASAAGITAIGVNAPGLYAVSSTNPAIELAGITDGDFNISRLEINAFRGTVAVPEDTEPGDNLGGYYVKGFYNGTYITASGVSVAWDPDADLETPFPASNLSFFVNGNGTNGSLATLSGLTGVFNSPLLQTSVFAVDDTPLPLATTVGAGARAFVTDATATTFYTVYTGGGSYSVPVYSDGITWRIG